MLTNVTLCALTRIRKMKLLSFIFNNVIFNNSNEEKIHGITIDNKLTFKSQIKILFKKTAQKIGTLSRLLRIQWRLSAIFKRSNKSVWSNIFWYIKGCILWNCIQYTIHWDKSQTLKNFPSDKINGTKLPSFFLCKLRLITVLLLICDSYMSWSTKFVSLKLKCGIFHFRFRFVFIKVYTFVQQNALTLWL